MLKIGAIFFKYRDYTPIPFVILLIIFAKADQTSLIIGTILLLLGELIRFLGVSHIGGVSRTRSYSTGQKLITSGLFAHVRNPLYIGNLFLSFGLILMGNVNWYFNLAFLLFFCCQYIPIVRWEENNLKSIFGVEFEQYMQKVPRWIPSIRSRTGNQEKIPGAYLKALKSERHTLAAAIVLYVIVLLRSGCFNGLF